MKTVGFISRVCLWLLIQALLVNYLHPELAFTVNTPTGGDVGGHYSALVYWVENILPSWKLVGWSHGNYAGFPLFEMYFPLPFALMALLGAAAPLSVAFKAVVLAGVWALPPSVFYFLKKLKYKNPIPDLGAVFSLLFLFNEASPAWGGTMASTLAGEFSYAFGLALSLVYLGRMYDDLPGFRHPLQNAFILAMVGLSHGYTLLFCVAGVSFFLFFTADWRKRLGYILEVNLLAFGLMGFWIVPLLLFSPYTTPFNFVWVINHWSEMVPKVMIPGCLLGLAGIAWGLARPLERGRTIFVFYLTALALVYYLVAFKIGVVDVRFLPYAQLFIVIFGAVAAGSVLGRLRAANLAALGLALIIAAWVAQNETVIDKWSRWNFTGAETKELWPDFKKVNDYLAGDFSDPRVVYEHGEVTEKTGSIRAFESLPFFAGRAVLEGLYIQAGLAAPFVFYIQSEVSQKPSMPLRQYNYSRFDLDRAWAHLKMFNVGQYITVSSESRAAALTAPEYDLEMTAGPFSVFKVKGGSGGYAVELEFLPVLVLTDNPKRDSFLWFRKGDYNVPVVFGSPGDDYPESRFAAVMTSAEFRKNVEYPPRVPVTVQGGLAENIGNEEITIKGVVPGRPVLVKVAFNPGWTAIEGARRIWRAAPCFMLIYPDSDMVRLRFQRTWPDYLGLILTAASLFFVLARAAKVVPGGAEILGPAFARIAIWCYSKAGCIRITACACLAGFILFLILAVSFKDPVVYYNRGDSLFRAGEYVKAAETLKQATSLFPLSPVIDQTIHLWALCEFRLMRFSEAGRIWSSLAADYPECRLLPEALYRMGVCYRRLGKTDEVERIWSKLRKMFPDSYWADLTYPPGEAPIIKEPPESFKRAMKFFDQGKYLEAEKMFLAVKENEGQSPLAGQCSYFAGMCRYRNGDWAAALEDFAFYQQEFPGGTFIPEILFHVGAARLRLGDRDGAWEVWERTAQEFPETRWGDMARELAMDLDKERGK